MSLLSTIRPPSPAGLTLSAAADYAAMLALLGAAKTGIQYLTANAVWDGSGFVGNDGGSYELSLFGQTGNFFFIGFALGAITITNSPGAVLDTTIAAGRGFFTYMTAAGDDGTTVTFIGI